MPNRFTKPGNPSSILIIKSCTPRPAEPFGPSLGLSQMGVRGKIPYAGVISRKGVTVDCREVFGYCFIHFVEMGVTDFVVCRICDPLNVRAKADPTSKIQSKMCAQSTTRKTAISQVTYPAKFISGQGYINRFVFGFDAV